MQHALPATPLHANNLSLKFNYNELPTASAAGFKSLMVLWKEENQSKNFALENCQ